MLVCQYVRASSYAPNRYPHVSGKDDLPSLDFALIPAVLKKNASAVVRYSRTEMRISPNSGVHQRVEKAITVLNEEGQSEANIFAFYRKSEPLKKLQIALYDEHGKLIRKVKSAEIEDMAYNDEVSMFNDFRYKQFLPRLSIFPYTLVFDEDNAVSNTLTIPPWEPQAAYALSIENSTLKVTVDQGFSINIHQQALSPPHTNEGEGRETNVKLTIQ